MTRATIMPERKINTPIAGNGPGKPENIGEQRAVGVWQDGDRIGANALLLVRLLLSA